MSNHKVPPNHSSVRPKSEEGKTHGRHPTGPSPAYIAAAKAGAKRMAVTVLDSFKERDADRLLAQLGAPGLGDDAAGLVAVHKAMHSAANALQASLDGPLAGEHRSRLNDEPAARFVHEVQMLIDRIGDTAADRLEGLTTTDYEAAKDRARILVAQAIALDDLDGAAALIDELRKGG